MSGFLITFEGGEGSGKSTQIARLARALKRLGRSVVVTREPGGTRLAESIRDLLLSARGLAPAAEALLFAAARADLVARVVGPALARGRVVLCDRFIDSTFAYQGAGRGLDREFLAPIVAAATGGIEPDLTVLLDLDPRIGLRRRRARGSANRFESDSADFHRRVRRGFLSRAAERPRRFLVLDATRSPEALAGEILAASRARLERRSRRAGIRRGAML